MHRLGSIFLLWVGCVFGLSAWAMTPEQIIEALSLPVNSTGNIADAVEEATGARGWMSADMKPIFDARIVGRAATAVLRPVLKNDNRAIFGAAAHAQRAVDYLRKLQPEPHH